MSAEFVKLITCLSEAPEGQIDPIITAKVKRLIGCDPEIVATELKEILGECVAGALCSDFAIWVIEESIKVAELEHKERSWHK